MRIEISDLKQVDIRDEFYEVRIYLTEGNDSPVVVEITDSSYKLLEAAIVERWLETKKGEKV